MSTRSKGTRLSVEMAEEHVANGHGGEYAHYCYRCESFESKRDAFGWQLAAIEKGRMWLSPGWLGVGFGEDEYQRRTVYFGRLVVALWRCRCVDCTGALAQIRAMADTDWGQDDRDKQRRKPMFSDRDHPPEFVDLAHPGADEPEPRVHLWGATCPCRPTPSSDGSLRHRSLDGTGWTERAEVSR